MAVLNNANRQAAADVLMRDLSDVREACGVTKAQFRAAVDAADDWIDSNAASFNNGLPTAAKNNLTAPQKARLLAAVILKRFATGA